MAALVRLSNAAIGYGHKALLTGIELSIEPDDFLAIVGPNGGGKTTLLRTLLGVLPPVSGTREAPRRLRVGYVPQRDHVDPHWPLNVLEVVLMGRVGLIGPGRRPGPMDRDRARAALDRVGIADLADRSFRTLSGGQRQRTLIARALAAEPELLALDEPTNWMDPGAEAATLDVIRGLHSGGGLAVIMISHRLEVVANCAKRLVLIDKEKQLWRVGAVEEILCMVRPGPSTGSGRADGPSAGPGRTGER
jgi:ABC-type Mn2+/Zn2+ transport system ATPase subunit